MTFTSDTHNRMPFIDPCDIAIHSGDFTMQGYLYELKNFIADFAAYPAKHKVFIAGNHDFISEENEKVIRKLAIEANLIYLRDETVDIDGLKIYGTPWTKKLRGWAWQLTEANEDATWNLIPEDTNIVITHCPPYGVGDSVARLHIGETDHHVGSRSLRRRIQEIKPMVHCFGHIHEGYGVYTPAGETTTYVNSAHMDRHYTPTNPPITLHIKC